MTEKTETLKIDADAKGFNAAMESAAAASGKLLESNRKLSAQFTEDARRVTERLSAYRKMQLRVDEAARAEYAYEKNVRALKKAMEEGQVAAAALAESENRAKREFEQGRTSLAAYEQQLKKIAAAHESGALAEELYAKNLKQIDAKYGDKAVAAQVQMLAAQQKRVETLAIELRLAGELPEVRARELAVMETRAQLQREGVALDSAAGQALLQLHAQERALKAEIDSKVAAQRAAVAAQEAAAKAQAAQAIEVLKTLDAQERKIALSRLELSLANAEEDARERALERRRLEMQLADRGIALDSTVGRGILANYETQARLTAEIQKASAARQAEASAIEEQQKKLATVAAAEKQLLATQANQLELLRAENRLAAEAPDVRARELALLRTRQELLSKGIAVDSGAGQAALANAAEIARLKAHSDTATKALASVGGASKLTREQLLTLQYTANDVVASLASGMSPLTILMQQGGQVTQACGGLTPTLRAAAGALGPVGFAVAGVTLAVGGAVAASESWRAELRAMTLASRAGGDATGYTRNQLIALGAATAEAASLSESAGRGIVAGLARARLGGDALAEVSKQARDFAALTQQDLPQATDALGKLFSDPAKGARELDAAYGLLTAAQLREIQTLTEQGRKTEAQLALSDALGKRIKGLATDEMSVFERGWNAIARAASNAWGAMGKSAFAQAGGPSIDQQIKAARSRVSQAPDTSKMSDDAKRALEAQNNPIFKGNNYAEDRTLDRSRAQMELLTLLRVKDRQELEAVGRAVIAVSDVDLKWLADSSAALDPVTAKRRALGNEIERVNAILANRSGLSAEEELGAAEFKSFLENQLKGVRTAEDQAKLDAKRAQSLVGLTAAQKAAKQAEFETQDAIERGVPLSQEAGIRAANLTKAMAGLADTQIQTMRATQQETAAALALADAYGVSDAAVHKAKIGAEAHAAAVSGQVASEHAYKAALLDRAAAQALATSAQATRDLAQQAADAARLAGVERQGAAAVRDMALALADEADARATLATATDATMARLLSELETRKRLRRELSETETSRKGNATLASQGQDLDALRLELSLVSRLPEERARELELLRVRQQLLRDGIDLNSETGRTILENAKAIGEVRGQLDKANKEYEAQQKIWDNAIEGIQSSFADAFENILSGGTNTWKDLGGSLKKVMFSAISEIAAAMVFKPVMGTAMNAVGLGSTAQSVGLGGGSSGGISGIFDKITGSIGNGTSGAGGITGGLNSWLFGSAGSGNALNPASYVPGTSGVLGSGGGAFGNSSLNIGTIGNAVGFGMSALNFAQNPSIGSGLGLVGSGMGALSALGVIGPAFGPIGMGVSLVASLLGGMGKKTKHPGMGIEIMNDAQGLALGATSGKHMYTSGARPMGQAAIDAINGTVRSLTGGTVGAGTGGQVYGLSYDASGGKQRYRAVGEGLSESTEYATIAEAISAVTVSALKNLPIDGVGANIATALKKSTADSLEGIKADLDFAKGFADSLSLMKSGLDPMKGQAAEIAKAAKDAAAQWESYGVTFRQRAVDLGQGTADEVNKALQSMMDGALGLTKASEPLSGYALAYEQARANIKALQETLVQFGLTAEQAGAKIAAATEAARVKLAGEQNAGLTREIQGLTDPRSAEMADLTKWRDQAIAEAKAIGNQQGIALIEQLFGLKQQEVVQKYADRTKGLTAAQQQAADALATMVSNLQSRALAVRQMDRAKALHDFDVSAAQQLRSAPAGTNMADLQAVLSGERAMVEFQGYQRDYLEGLDRQIRGLDDQKGAIQAQISAAKAQTDALNAVRESLLKFQQDLKLDKGLSILSTGDRRAEAMARLDGLYARGMGGDTKALAEYEGLARQFLQISREYNASTPGYVSDYQKVEGQLNGVLGKIKTPLQVAEAQLATLEAQSKQFDVQIDLLRAQREQAARLGERQLDSLDSLKAGMMDSLARLQAAQSALAAGLAGALGARGGAGGGGAGGAANSNQVLGADGRPVGLLGGGLNVVGQDNTAYSEWAQDKKDAWDVLRSAMGLQNNIYDLNGMTQKYGQDFLYAGNNDSRLMLEFLANHNTTFDQALRDAAAGKFSLPNILNTEKANGMATGGMIPGFAKGGPVGNGVWGVDSVRARYAGGGDIALAGGEFVITAPSVNQNTLPYLRSINETGRLPRISLPASPAPRAASVDLAPLAALMRDVSEKLDLLVDVVVASGDQNAEVLAQVRDASAAVARETRNQRIRA